jgi:4-hydroxy-tetrahydrodipicolinate synthase
MLAKTAETAGCSGLMVLPPYVYVGDWREMKAHVAAVLEATKLSCMLYNNPIAYGTDVTPDQLAELARHDNLHAVKESSGDVRRVTAVIERLGGRLNAFAGLDDMIVESVAMGASGWIAGLVNALPAESVRLFDLARSDRSSEARSLYEWFLPLLRLDTLPKFVQLIKLAQVAVGKGNARVRPPRLELTGAEYEAAVDLIRERLSARPAGDTTVSASPSPLHSTATARGALHGDAIAR